MCLARGEGQACRVRCPPPPLTHICPPLPSRVRVIGSSTLALCYLASGAADAYYQFGLHCWDLAAATVIIREAGGIVIDTSGKLYGLGPPSPRCTQQLTVKQVTLNRVSPRSESHRIPPLPLNSADEITLGCMTSSGHHGGSWSCPFSHIS